MRPALLLLAVLVPALCAGCDDGPTGAKPDPSAVTSISAGANHTCAVAGSGVAFCWGDDWYGQLGDGFSVRSPEPVPTFGDLTFSSISAGATHTCGLTQGGRAYCWGRNYRGQLGDGTEVTALTPVAVAGELAFIALSAGSTSTCGVATDGAGYCWGSNSYGLLARVSTDRSPLPLRVGELTFSSISVGASHACGVATNGAGYCWGSNYYGLTGNGTSGGYRPAPDTVVGEYSFRTITAGTGHTCGLTTDGAALCWGRTDFGRLGNGAAVPDGTTSSPVAVTGGLVFETIEAGGDHTCAITQGGAAYCWGGNTAGQLGDGTNTDRPYPVSVRGGLAFRSVDAGDRHTCGVTRDGLAYCWGDNQYGELGDGSSGPSNHPVQVGLVR